MTKLYKHHLTEIGIYDNIYFKLRFMPVNNVCILCSHLYDLTYKQIVTTKSMPNARLAFVGTKEGSKEKKNGLSNLFM